MGKKLLIVLLILLMFPLTIFIIFVISELQCKLELKNYPTTEVRPEILKTYNLILQDRNTFIAKMEEKPAECWNAAEFASLRNYSSEFLFGTENLREDNDKLIDQILLSDGWEKDSSLVNNLGILKQYKKKVSNFTYSLTYEWNRIPIVKRWGESSSNSNELFDKVKRDTPDVIQKIDPRLENTPYVFSIDIEHSKY